MEDSLTEYKAGIYCDYERLKKSKKHRKDLAKEIIAFANAYGGKIILGVNDNGEEEPLDQPENVLKYVTEIFRDSIKPRILFHQEKIVNDEKALEISIQSSPQVHYVDGEVWFRIGESKQRVYGDAIQRIMEQKQRTKPDYWHGIKKAIFFLENLIEGTDPAQFFFGLIDFCLRCGVLEHEKTFYIPDMLDTGSLLENWLEIEYEQLFPKIPEDWEKVLKVIRYKKDSSEIKDLTNEVINNRYKDLLEEGKNILNSMGELFEFRSYAEENKYTSQYYYMLPSSYRSLRASLVYRMYQLTTWDNRPLEEIPKKKIWGKLFFELEDRATYYSSDKTKYIAQNPNFCWERIKEVATELFGSYDSFPHELSINLYYLMKEIIHPYCKSRIEEVLKKNTIPVYKSICTNSDCKLYEEGCSFIGNNKRSTIICEFEKKLDEERVAIALIKHDLHIIINYLSLYTT